MRLKLVIALVSDELTDSVIDAARKKGATGATVISSGRGEGLKKKKTFFGLDLAAQRDIILFIVADSLSRYILEAIADVGNFDEEPGSGVAFQLPIEDVVGLGTQIPTLLHEIEEEL